jgi:hypothetical protein
MLTRIVAAILVVFAATTAAEAQRPTQTGPRPLPQPPRAFPAEKFSTRPVQATPGLPADPSGSEKLQKQRWHQRSRTSPGEAN